MIHRVRRLGIAQLAKVLGVLYLLLGVVFAALFAVFGTMMPGEDGGMFTGGLLFAMPLLYGLMGIVFGALVAWLYNLVAPWTGGVEMELQPADGVPREEYR